MNATAQTFKPKLLVTKDVAASMISVHGRTLQRLTQPNGTIPCVRIGGGKRPLLRYAVSDLEQWIAEQQAASEAAE